VVIPAMGLTMGEMFYLRDLAADCSADGVYEFFFADRRSSSPALPARRSTRRPSSKALPSRAILGIARAAANPAETPASLPGAVGREPLDFGLNFG
jgi:hypothetical protein